MNNQFNNDENLIFIVDVDSLHNDSPFGCSYKVEAMICGTSHTLCVYTNERNKTIEYDQPEGTTEWQQDELFNQLSDELL